MTHISIFRHHLLILFFLMGTVVSFSQGPTMDWAAESDLVNADSEDVAVTSIINKQGNSLVWDQIADGLTETNVFIIMTITGTWDDQSNLGEIDYALDIDDSDSDGDASLKVIGDADGITLRLVLHDNDALVTTYIFRIDSLIQI